MVLADAACWGLEVEVVLRSEPYNRTSSLGSFLADFVFVQDLRTAFTVFDALPTFSESAAFHPRPGGQACAASPATRTVAIPAGLRIPVGMKLDPRAGARASS